MTRIVVAGEVTSALTHFAQAGLASIVEEVLGCSTRLGWTDSLTPRAYVDCPGTSDGQVGEAIRAHAYRAAAPASWLRGTVHHGGRVGTATFSPRIKLASDDSEWKRLQQARSGHLDLLLDEGRDGDLRFLGALGEPAHWRFESRERRPDHGASRWEMKTRNKGEEFVGQRLLPLAEVVAERSPEANVDGITGVTRRDELGRNKAESRTSTGFTPPGPTDSALAWCALWGIGNFPLAHRVNGLSVTPGAFPSDALHPRVMYLPVVVGSVTTARMRSLLVSAQLATFGAAGLDTRAADPDGLMVESARKWLYSRRVAAVVRFQILKTGSSSAPERQVIGGDLVLTGDPA